nr:reverse transcriptase domain-containing protein [Tanacetum cinerariifolium]
MTNTRSGMTPAVIKEMINRRMTEALEAREANRNLRLRNGNDEGGNGNGDGNKNRGGNGNGNHNRNDGEPCKQNWKQEWIGEARGKAYVLGRGDANPNSNVVISDGRIFKTNTVLRGCTLGLLGHPFNIDLMPVELGSFDIIIGMDWLANHHAVIVCDEKIV